MGGGGEEEGRDGQRVLGASGGPTKVFCSPFGAELKHVGTGDGLDDNGLEGVGDDGGGGLVHVEHGRGD
jgi:hypothetical protein